ncbi:MAG: tryptophan synthase subunit alpha, partial [Dehalobacterium sp.]
LILLATPTSTDERLKKISRMARGFIYCVSVVGVTGARSDISHQLTDLVNRLRGKGIVSLAAGFGISGPENAKKAAALTDGVIVGSALIDRIEQSLSIDPNDDVKAIREACLFIRELKKSINGRKFLIGSTNSQ